jgi:hypothetical protein
MVLRSTHNWPCKKHKKNMPSSLRSGLPHASSELMPGIECLKPRVCITYVDTVFSAY